MYIERDTENSWVQEKTKCRGMNERLNFLEMIFKPLVNMYV